MKKPVLCAVDTVLDTLCLSLAVQDIFFFYSRMSTFIITAAYIVTSVVNKVNMY